MKPQGPELLSLAAFTADLRQMLQRTFRLVHWRVWQGRLAIWLGAAVLSLTIIVFSTLVDRGTSLFFLLRESWPYIPFLLTPLGGMVVAWLTQRYFAGAEGSGIPQTIAALKANGNARVESGLVSLRIVVAKVVLGAAALCCGFSAGKEGPSVQIGASIMLACKKILPDHIPLRSEHLLLAGGAAGIAVAFNTPIAGIVFAIEELGRRFDRQTNIVLLSAIIVASAISISHWGNFTYFGRLAVGDSSRQMLLPILVLGIVGGVLGGLFSRLMIMGSHPSLTIIGRLRGAHPVWFAGACGLGVAVLGFLSDGLIHGGGYLVTRSALEGGATLPLPFALEKMAATLLSYFAGIPGGVFAPCLTVGAAIGQELHGLGWFGAGMDVWMALGMAAFLAGVTQVPITAFVIVMEMIDGHSLVLSLISVALLASMVAKIFSQAPYHALARQFLLGARVRAAKD